MDERATVPEPGARPRPGAAGRAAKLVPPRDPSGTLDRPDLEARLASGTGRRLTILTAGAGFGKSTLAARVARAGHAAWYTIDSGDVHLGAFAAGVIDALRRALPGLPGDLATPIATAVDPRDEAEAAHRGQAAATLVADALHVALDTSLLLVLDDCHELAGAAGPWRFIESLVRFAPDGLCLALVSRDDPPFGVERLRAQGEVADLGGPSLAFTPGEIAALVTSLLPDDVVPRRHRETLFELLWPDEDPEPLANRLSVALATARAVMDPEKRFGADWFVGGDKQAVWLELGHVALDVEQFLGEATDGLRLARTGDAHVGLVRALLVAGRHGEARRRYGIYADRMEEMAVEAAPIPSVPARAKVA